MSIENGYLREQFGSEQAQWIAERTYTLRELEESIPQNEEQTIVYGPGGYINRHITSLPHKRNFSYVKGAANSIIELALDPRVKPLLAQTLENFLCDWEFDKFGEKLVRDYETIHNEIPESEHMPIRSARSMMSSLVKIADGILNWYEGDYKNPTNHFTLYPLADSDRSKAILYRRINDYHSSMRVAYNYLGRYMHINKLVHEGALDDELRKVLRGTNHKWQQGIDEHSDDKELRESFLRNHGYTFLLPGKALINGNHTIHTASAGEINLAYHFWQYYPAELRELVPIRFVDIDRGDSF